MSERGVFAVDRGVFDHDKLRDDRAPFSKVEAWLWLLSSAAWKPHRRRVSGHNFDLERGQLVASTRYMAERWRWSEARVRRFLDLLKTDAGGDAMIDARSDAGVTVITIRKYDLYQRVSLPDDAPSDAAIAPRGDAGATQERRNEEDIQTKESDGGGDAREVAVDKTPDPERGKSLLSAEAFEVSALVLEAMGLEPDHPLSCGSPLTIQGWLNSGWHRDCILAGVRRAMRSRARDGPPSTLKYFEQAIARAHAELSPTLPKSDGAPSGERSADPTGYRTSNPHAPGGDRRPTGHDAVLASAARRAGRIGAERAVAERGGAPAPAGGAGGGVRVARPGIRDGAFAGVGGTDGAGQAGRGDGGDAEIIPPDQAAVGPADRARNIRGGS